MSRSFGPGCSRAAIASRASSRMRSSHFFKEAGRNHSAAIFLTIVCSGGSRYVTVSRTRRLPPVSDMVKASPAWFCRIGLCEPGFAPPPLGKTAGCFSISMMSACLTMSQSGS